MGVFYAVLSSKIIQFSYQDGVMVVGMGSVVCEKTAHPKYCTSVQLCNRLIQDAGIRVIVIT